MNSDKYKEYFTEEYLMGPNSIRILDELLGLYPLKLNQENHILDLGCGTGLTSLFIANETGANVYANDLWVSKEENLTRFKKWKMEDRLIPIHEDANHLSLEKELCDAVISIDSYHYFAGEAGFFEEKILPFIKRGGVALIAIPGIKQEYEENKKELLEPWLKDEYYMFHSEQWWTHIIGTNKEIEYCTVKELSSCSIAWEEWLSNDSKYALEDKVYYDSIIKKYTNIIGIVVKKK